MCGFVVTSRVNEIKTMTMKQKFRGPTDTGYTIKNGLAFGHVLLDVNGEHQVQPFKTKKGNILVFNGEMYDSNISNDTAFLGNGLDDPREDLIKYLVETCGNEGPILVYNIAFERTIIRQLIRDFPAYESALLDIEKRLVDLMPVFKKMVKTEMTSKSASLKVVLPTFLPKEKDYSNLDIQQGMETVQVYRELPTLADDEAETARQQMLAYCKMDTEAVLKLYQKLFEFI